MSTWVASRGCTGDDRGCRAPSRSLKVAVDAHGPVVTTEMPRLIGADQGAGRCGKALAVGRRKSAVAPDRGKRQPMLMLDDLGVGGLQCRVAHQPAGGMLKVGCRQPLDAAAHGGEPGVGAVGDQGGEQRAVEYPRHVARSRRAAGRRG